MPGGDRETPHAAGQGRYRMIGGTAWGVRPCMGSSIARFVHRGSMRPWWCQSGRLPATGCPAFSLWRNYSCRRLLRACPYRSEMNVSKVAAFAFGTPRSRTARRQCRIHLRTVSCDTFKRSATSATVSHVASHVRAVAVLNVNWDNPDHTIIPCNMQRRHRMAVRFGLVKFR